jgi:hypothetical protein
LTTPSHGVVRDLATLLLYLLRILEKGDVNNVMRKLLVNTQEWTIHLSHVHLPGHRWSVSEAYPTLLRQKQQGIEVNEDGFHNVRRRKI